MKFMKHILTAFAERFKHTYTLRKVPVILLIAWVLLPAAFIEVPAHASAEFGGTQGCGLAPEPYSYDGGQSWTADSMFTVEENGTYEVLVRDKLGNRASYKVTVDRIDRTAPEVLYTLTPDTYTKDDVAVMLQASDDVSGLAPEPYSFDGGQTWVKEPAFLMNAKGTLEAAVRDKAGNQCTVQIPVEIIDREAPVIHFKTEPENWYEGSAVLTVQAEDAGAGLDAKPYSWDQGQTYQAAGRKVIEGPGEYRILVRDALGNCGYGIYYAAYAKRPEEGGSGSEDSGMGSGADSSETLPAETDPDETVTVAQTPDTESTADAEGEGHDGVGSGHGTGDESDGVNSKNMIKRVSDLFTAKEDTSPSFLDLLRDFLLPASDKGKHSEPEELQAEQGEYREPIRMAAPQAGELSGTSALKRFFSTPAGTVILTLTMIAVVLTGTGSVLYLLLMSARVFNDDGEKHYRLLGICLIRRNEEYYRIRLTRRMEERCITESFRICPGPGFVMLNRGEEFAVEDVSGEKAAVMLVDGQMEYTRNASRLYRSEQ